MSKTLTYYTEFGNRPAIHAGREARYRIEIWGEGNNVAGEISVDFDAPAMIEWAEVAKLDPVQGSALTLRLVSESDREFVGLYTVEEGAWRVDIYRNKALYWRGSIDTELYEEPYSTSSGYIVEVTASDLGPADRTDFDMTGRHTIEDIIRHCLSRTAIADMEQVISISTSLPDAKEPLSLSDLYIDTANFYDEDGEPMTCREVLEEVLRPFALRLAQRNGEIHIFDLNAASAWPSTEVCWVSNDARMGVDVTYNKVKVLLSTYSDANGCDGSLDHDEVLKGSAGDLYYTGERDHQAIGLPGFRMASGQEQHPQLEICNNALVCRMDAEWSGSDTAGVVWQYMGLKALGSGYQCMITRDGDNWPAAMTSGTFVPIAKTRRHLSLDPYQPVYVGSSAGGEVYTGAQLRVSLDLLLDTRYNPFEDAGADNGGTQYGKALDIPASVRIPVQIVCRNIDGEIAYLYNNDSFVSSYSYTGGEGQWIPYTAANMTKNICWLQYYDWDDWNGKSPVGGWVANRQSIGDPKATTKTMKKRGDGYYISMPPCVGSVELWVGKGFGIITDGSDGWLPNTAVWRSDAWDKFVSHLRWLAYRNPKIELVKSSGKDLTGSDLEDSAYIVRTAKEELSIDTIVGTPGDRALPTSRAMMTLSDGRQIRRMTRAGVTDRIERLLIGTAYSQYVGRNTVLNGTAELVPDMPAMTDASAPGEIYIMLSDRQNLAADTSEIRIVRFAGDSYEGIEVTTTTQG